MNKEQIKEEKNYSIALQSIALQKSKLDMNFKINLLVSKQLYSSKEYKKGTTDVKDKHIHDGYDYQAVKKEEGPDSYMFCFSTPFQ